MRLKGIYEWKPLRLRHTHRPVSEASGDVTSEVRTTGSRIDQNTVNGFSHTVVYVHSVRIISHWDVLFVWKTNTVHR